MIDIFVSKNQIGKLYRNHGSEYHEVIYKVCKNEVLNQAQTFSLDDFRKNRPAIKESIKEKLEFKDNEILEKRKKYRWNKMWFEHTKKRGRYENKTNEHA